MTILHSSDQPKAFKESLVFFSSALFHTVQMSGLFADSKQFADATPKSPWPEIYQQFDYLSSSENFDLAGFVKQYFHLPSPIKLDAHTPITSVKEHIEALWPLLTKKPDEPSNNSLLPLHSPYLVPGGRFREIYYWDSYFTALGLVCSGRRDLVKSMVLNFIQLQQQIGCIPNGNRSYYNSRSQPPVLGLMVEMLIDSETGDTDQAFLRQCVNAMDTEYAFWMEGSNQLTQEHPAHRRVVRMPNGGLLNRYWDDQATPRPESYKEDKQAASKQNVQSSASYYRNIRAACESGWDFSSRWLDDPHNLDTIQTTDIVPIDLNSLLFNLEKLLSKYWEQLGDLDKSERYLQKSERRKQTIQTYLWSEEFAYFMDVNLKSAKQTHVVSLAGVLPLFVQLANDTQAKLVAVKIQQDFLNGGGLVTTLCQSEQQWDSPNGWAPLHWFAVIGLENYQFDALAQNIMQNWSSTIEYYFQAHGSLMEKYNVQEIDSIAQGGEYEVQHGFGWTNGVSLAFYEKLKDN